MAKKYSKPAVHRQLGSTGRRTAGEEVDVRFAEPAALARLAAPERRLAHHAAAVYARRPLWRRCRRRRVAAVGSVSHLHQLGPLIRAAC